MKLMTNTQLIALTNEVITTHAFPILQELGLEKDNDGILGKISASSQIGEDTPEGIFMSEIRKVGLMGMKGTSYVKGSGSITIYPIMLKMFKKKNGDLGTNLLISLIISLFAKQVKKQLVFILAHEMRHYWQYYTNTVFTKGDYIGGTRFTPYSMRWEEKDANDWAKAYIEKRGI